MVYPFYCEGERRSFSMNIEVVQHNLDDNGNLAEEKEYTQLFRDEANSKLAELKVAPQK